jgi:hypothetical protein
MGHERVVLNADVSPLVLVGQDLEPVGLSDWPDVVFCPRF